MVKFGYAISCTPAEHSVELLANIQILSYFFKNYSIYTVTAKNYSYWFSISYNKKLK